MPTNPISAPKPPNNDILEHWLLNLAVEFPVGLALLFPSVEAVALNVKTIRDLRPEDYAAALMRLFEAGSIRFLSEVAEDDLQTASGVEQILGRFIKLSKDDSSLRREGKLISSYERRKIRDLQVEFELTPRGGQTWANFAEPNWTRCFTDSLGETDCELVSQNLELALSVIGWFQELNGGIVDVNSIQIQKLQDYPIFYWKRLPSVFRLRFNFVRGEPRWEGEGPSWTRGPKWFHEWRNELRSWYRKPWETPEWPPE